MAEQQATTPTEVAPSSFEDKMAEKLFGETEAPEETTPDTPAEEAAPEGEADEGLLEVEQPEEAPQSPDEVELVHNGQQVKVSKEQAKNLAQMGYDYNVKMQALNQDRTKVQQVAQALQAQATLQTQLLDHAAVVKSFDMQLTEYPKYLEQLAESDPLEYPKAQARYQRLMEQRNGAYAQMMQAYSQAQQAQTFVTAETRAMEQQKLLEKVPEWRDPKRYEKEAPAIFSSLEQWGFNQQELANSGILEDHRAITILRKAYLYDQAVARAKSKTPAKVPGVAKPGATQQRTDASNDAILTKQLRQTTDPAKKKALFDQKMAKKLFG